MNLSNEEFMRGLAFNIVTRREIAERCEVHERNVHSWTERRQTNHFPSAIRSVGGKAGRPSELYWWPAVYEWYITYVPKRGPKINGARYVAPMGNGK